MRAAVSVVYQTGLGAAGRFMKQRSLSLTGAKLNELPIEILVHQRNRLFCRRLDPMGAAAGAFRRRTRAKQALPRRAPQLPTGNLPPVLIKYVNIQKTAQGRPLFQRQRTIFRLVRPPLNPEKIFQSGRPIHLLAL